MKSPRYTAGVVSIYKKYVDMYRKQGRSGYRVDPADRRMLLDLFDRGGQSDGYYKTHNGRDMVVLKEKPAFREGNQELFDYLDRTYVNGIRKEKIRGTAYFEVGKPARLTVSAELTGRAAENVLDAKWKEKRAASASLLAWVDGDVVEEAKNAPMNEARIRKQLMKTGDSSFEFEELTITVKGNVFVPVQALNSMRRRALEALEKGILDQYRRTMPEEPIGSEPADCGREAEAETEEELTLKKAGENRQFAALVSSKEQFEAVLGCMSQWKQGEPDRNFGIYLASEEFDASGWKSLVEKCHDAGVECFLMMPRIFRTHAERYFLKNLDAMKSAGFDAFGVASMEEPGFFRQYAPEAKLYFDHGMYSFNHLAAETMKQYGASRITIPVELNSREIMDTKVEGEMIVYGYLPMMVSAQCIRKTTEGCSGKPELLYLKDRKGAEFPVKNQCRFCCNTIYNESPLSLLGMSGDVERFAPCCVRLNFTIEDKRRTEQVLNAFYQEYVEKKAAAPLAGYTRGHFKRGVE